jgi:hypothetical protein
MAALSDFLLRDAIPAGGVLPVIHTTTCYHLKKFRGENKILTCMCDVFSSDKLSYFFVGRPAYKLPSDGSESEYWELPCCLVFQFTALSNIKRIFPFDSGAFAKKKYPPYINLMDINEFESCSAPNAVSRIIGAFFGDVGSYFRLRAKDRSKFEGEFPLGLFDAEIKALHRLSLERAPASFDDRRFAIEVQSAADVDLTVTHPLAVIAPLDYFDDEPFRTQVETMWKAVPLGYPMFPLNTAAYYGLVYQKVDEFFKTKGFYGPDP